MGLDFDYAEELWKKVSDIVDATDGKGIDFYRLPKGMAEAALEAFEARKLYMADCEKLREALECKPTPHDYVVAMADFLNGSGAEQVEATFNVDNYKVTITAERKGE